MGVCCCIGVESMYNIKGDTLQLFFFPKFITNQYFAHSLLELIVLLYMDFISVFAVSFTNVIQIIDQVLMVTKYLNDHSAKKLIW